MSGAPLVCRAGRVPLEPLGVERRQHFVFIARARSTGNGVLRHAIRNEIRLLTSELATDLARFPVLREWTSDDLRMLAGLLVNAKIATVEAILEGPESAPDGEAVDRTRRREAAALTMIGVPHWRSRG